MATNQEIDLREELAVSSDEVHFDPEIKSQEMLLNMGPQHPSTHGVLRLVLSLEGETVTSCTPVIGYLHRGIEKILENRPVMGGIRYMDNADYLSPMLNEIAYAGAVEQLMNIELPRRAQYIRLLVGEMQRIASHLVATGTYLMDLGAVTPILWAFRDREGILSMFEALGGSRFNVNYMRVGGVLHDFPKGWLSQCEAFLDQLTKNMVELERLITGNEIFEARTQGVGYIDPQQAIAYGLTGPILRACGVNWDLRVHRPYMAYREVPVNIQIRQEGDCYARYRVRMLEIVESIRLCREAEDVHVSKSDKALFLIAPSVFLAPVIGVFVVLPFSPYLSTPGGALATGLVYLVAMSSLDVVGVIMAGWSSNNKYSLIGGLRSAAQMISYELPLVLALISVVMLTSVLAGLPGMPPNPPGQDGVGTISIREIMDFQNAAWQHTGIGILDFLFQGFTPWSWFILIQPLMLIIYYTCGLAETNRTPFDLPEAESELVAGYLTEYSGMRWAMFFLGEYGNMTIVSAIASYLFLGGFAGPGVVYLTALNDPWWGLVGNLLALGYFILKIYLLCLVFIWIRSTLPRLRSDQLMQFAWLILMPVTLGNIIVTGLLYLIIVPTFGAPAWLFLIVLGVVNWIALFLFINLVTRVTVSSTRRAQAPAMRARLRSKPAIPTPALPLRDGVPTRVGELPQRVSAAP